MIKILVKNRVFLLWAVALSFVVYELFITNGFYGVSQTIQAQNSLLSSGDIGVLGFVSFLVYAICQIPAGLIASRVPTRRVLSIAASLVSGGLFLYGISDGFALLLLSRMIISVGAAFAFVSIAVVITRVFSAKYFPVMFAVTQFFGNISVVLANLFLPAIIGFLGSWRWVSFILMFVGIGIVALVLHFLKLDTTESKTTAPTVDIKESFRVVLTSKSIWVMVIFAGLLLGSLFNFGADWQISFQNTFANNDLQISSSMNAIMFLGVALGNPAFGYLALRMDKVKLLTISAGCGAVLMGLLLFLPPLSSDFAAFLCFLFGVACSGGMLVYTLVVEKLPAHAQGIGVGLCNTIVYTVGALLSLIIGTTMSALSSQISWFFDTHVLLINKVALSFFFFALLQAFTIGFFMKTKQGRK